LRERERDRERARNQTNLRLEITMDHSLKVAKWYNAQNLLDHNFCILFTISSASVKKEETATFRVKYTTLFLTISTQKKIEWVVNYNTTLQVGNIILWEIGLLTSIYTRTNKILYYQLPMKITKASIPTYSLTSNQTPPL
jgi:hypothetical protein